jgi:hypothetical protein
MSDTTSRIVAILDYDGIQEGDRMKHLMRECGLSQYMAKLVLAGNDPRRLKPIRCIATGLDVSLPCLLAGELGNFHPRTFRIYMQQILNYPQFAVDKILRMFVGYKAGYRKATNLIDLAAAGKITAYDAACLM